MMRLHLTLGWALLAGVGAFGCNGRGEPDALGAVAGTAVATKPHSDEIQGSCRPMGAAIHRGSCCPGLVPIGGTCINPEDVIGSVGRTFAGTQVTLLTPIRGLEGRQFDAATKDFEQATGIHIKAQGADRYEDELVDQVLAGRPPDLAIFPQPGLLADLVHGGAVIPHPELVPVVVANDVPGWTALGSVDGTFYAVPLGANVKSLVFYNPRMFSARGYGIPTTWDDLLALSERIVQEGGTPWCVGMESGTATGWVGTDWVEDLMLRLWGAAVYDQWVAHTIPFDDPAVIAAFDEAARVLKNERYIKGGVASELTEPFFTSPLGLLDGSCWLHKQANFAEGFFPGGTAFGPAGDIDVFYFPGLTPTDRPLLGGGELLASFSSRPPVTIALLYLTSAHFANERLAHGLTTLSPNKGFAWWTIGDPIVAESARLLLSSTGFRFDGSDAMPFEVGTGTFWTGIVDWILGTSSADVAHAIEASWPR